MLFILYASYDDNGDLIAQPGIAEAIQGDGNFTSSPNPLNEINSGGGVDAVFRGQDGQDKIYRPIPQAAIDINEAEIPQNPGYN